MALVLYVPPAPTTLTNFPDFKKLPIEIQLIIWKMPSAITLEHTSTTWYAKAIRNGLLQIFHELVMQSPTQKMKGAQGTIDKLFPAVAKSFPRFSELAPNIRAKTWGFAVGDMLPLSGYHEITCYNDGRGFCIHFSRSSTGK